MLRSTAPIHPMDHLGPRLAGPAARTERRGQLCDSAV